MIGHLGQRVTDLLDGRMASEEEERAWAHVHGCHACRDLVEHEGWVKTRLSRLTSPVTAPSDLHSMLLDAGTVLTPGEVFLVAAPEGPRPRRAGLVALGGGAAGAAVMGVLALGAAPAQAPTLTPRPPTTTVTTPLQVSVVSHPRKLLLP